jgi:hypothetical protein
MKMLWCQVCNNYSVPYHENDIGECYICKIQALQTITRDQSDQIRKLQSDLQEQKNLTGEWVEKWEKAEKELSEARKELGKHLVSTVEYGLVDGIRQIAQAALAWKGNSEQAELMYQAAHSELETSNNQLGACKRVANEQRAQVERLVEATNKFIAWNEKYPSSRIYSESSIRKIAAELDAIAADSREALASIKEKA